MARHCSSNGFCFYKPWYFRTDNEVKALIGLWGESDVQEELDGAVRNKVVYEEIAKKMRQQGYNRDWGQCRNKIKNLIQSSKGQQ